jgi:hypothetical protein
MPPKRDVKAIAKKEKKAPAKKEKAAAKDPAPPKLSRKGSKKVEPAKEVKQPAAKRAKTVASEGKVLDLALLMDCTASMASWIERSKTTLKTIIDNVVASSQGLKVRVTYIGYRDFGDKNRFEIQPFTEDV